LRLTYVAIKAYDLSCPQVPETRSDALDSSIPALSLIKMRWVMLRGYGGRLVLRR